MFSRAFDMNSLNQQLPMTTTTTSSGDGPTKAFFDHNQADHVNTDAHMFATIQNAHPELRVTILLQAPCNLLAFAQGTGLAKVEPIIDNNDVLTEPFTWRMYVPPGQRLSSDGAIASTIKFGKFSYSYDGHDYILYIVDCRDGSGGYPSFTNQYLLHGDSVEIQSKVDKLILDVGDWSNTLQGEIWVFDSGSWQKQKDLWRSISKASWDDVILDAEMEKTLREDAKNFFGGGERYRKYRIAWKRGVIYFGPPGNGKTVSLKALSHELYSRSPPIPTLYVRSLTSFGGPEYSVKQIFAKARAEAPCLLVFEDLDSIVTDQVRSYFLNEVDGLNTNDGVYMIGSTNHLDRLDPGISKRPSRFDRKFEFPKPDMQQRITYCEYWRHKLQQQQQQQQEQGVEGGQVETANDIYEDDMVHVDGDEIEFPKELSPEIAKITDGFSFAYLQEAFVATLLFIASSGGSGGSGQDSELGRPDIVAQGKGKGKGGDKFDSILFWRVIKKQVALLKEQI